MFAHEREIDVEFNSFEIYNEVFKRSFSFLIIIGNKIKSHNHHKVSAAKINFPINIEKNTTPTINMSNIDNPLQDQST